MPASKDIHTQHEISLHLIGPCGVGKSTFLQYFINGAYQPQCSSIGLRFHTDQVYLQAKKVSLQIIDHSGHDRIQKVSQSYYKNASVILAFVDLADRDSLHSIQSYVQAAKSVAPEVPIILIGTKLDVATSRHGKTRSINTEEFYQIAAGCGYAGCMPTSARNGTGIKDAIMLAANLGVAYQAKQQASLAKAATSLPISAPKKQMKVVMALAWKEIKKFFRRHWGKILLAAFVGALVVGGIGFGFLPSIVGSVMLIAKMAGLTLSLAAAKSFTVGLFATIGSLFMAGMTTGVLVIKESLKKKRPVPRAASSISKIPFNTKDTVIGLGIDAFVTPGAPSESPTENPPPPPSTEHCAPSSASPSPATSSNRLVF